MFPWLSRWFLNAGARRHHDGAYCGTRGSELQELAGMPVGFGRTLETANPEFTRL